MVVALFFWASGGLTARPYAYQVTGGSTISVFDTTTRRETGAIGVGGNPSNIVVGPGGRRIYATAENGNGTGCGVFAANTTTRAVTAWQQSLCATSRLVVSPRGGLLYAIHHWDGGVDILRPDTLEVAGTIHGQLGRGYVSYSAGLSADGRHLYLLEVYFGSCSPVCAASNGLNLIEVINLQTGSLESSVPVGYGQVMTLSPDGTKLFFATSDSSGNTQIEEMDTATGAVLGMFAIAPDQMAVSMDGAQLYAVVGGQIEIVSVATGQITGVIGIADQITGSLAINPVRAEAYVPATGVNGYEILIIDLTQEVVTGSMPLVWEGAALTVAPDGETLYAGLTYQPTAISVVDSATQRAVGAIECTGNALGVTVSPNARRVYALCGPASFSTTPSTLISANALTFERIRSVPITGITGASHLAVSPDGKTVYVPTVSGSTQTQIQAFDAISLQSIGAYQVDMGTVSDLLAVSPDGRFLYVCANSHNVLWVFKLDLRSGKVAGAAYLPLSRAYALVLASAGDRLYVGGNTVNHPLPGEMLALRTSDMALLAAYPYCGQYMALSLDGGSLYSVGCSTGLPTTVYQIDTAAGTLKNSFQIPGWAPFGIAITPDDQQIYISNGGSGFGILVVDSSTGAQNLIPLFTGYQIVMASQ